jgi:hypothetical protein
VKSVFHVPQPYSLPNVSTPSMSASTPPKKGKPPMRAETRLCGSRSPSGSDVESLRYVAYGTT